MKDQLKTGLLIAVFLLTAYNTYQISTIDTYGPAVSKVVARKSDVTKNQVKPTNIIPENKNDKPKFDPINKDKIAKPTAPKTTIKFSNIEHDFGTIAQNSTNKYVYKFVNTGKEPLIVTNAKGSCGCTVPRWPKEPIAPGKEGEIEIIYKPGKQKNKQSKTITITANTEPVKTILRVKANVIPADPVN